ncbi:cytochrome c oxidase assembly protein [Oceanobacillus kimchii]|uniref:cytochrome c oxidase assembly protein n=1 Tax=Oceanobacillus kimchii TaxID=746691 RepID=UPI0021A57452|nr:cytochrome c oxidase assembly protein [Oceanobacillus kimchii]MCT1578472.1 cytochrome c oxidase assembly protein [Oceanobacillus kimchii]MCT2136479.1 cytochrome c oxidase assembly protein [Oceanobacillus kimchii]
MINHGHHESGLQSMDWLIAVVVLILIITYIGAGLISNKKKHLGTWPFYRYILWLIGFLLVGVSLVGPIAELAHRHFTAHMLSHLLLGMLAPLLLALAAPTTLLLRMLPVQHARILSKLLKTPFFSLVRHPIIASVLNIGGLWVLYTTNLYMLMHENIFVHLIVHFHIFAAGYLFTISMIYIDPTPHRFSYLYRAVVFVFALAGHGILSKFIYANPPVGVPKEQAEAGGILMYYGGDAIDIVIIFILCLHWYRSTIPKSSLHVSQN